MGKMNIYCIFFSVMFIANFSFTKQSRVKVTFLAEQVEFQRRVKRETKNPICTNLTSCEGRCSKKRMFHDIEDMDKQTCYCDPECDEVFTDCCADYHEKCGKPMKEPPMKTLEQWSCFSRKEYPFKIWMISGCKAGWSKKDKNAKYCPLFKDANPVISWITPVYAAKATYRNRYCALCNGVKEFKTWKHKNITCSVKVPKKSTEEQKLKHYDKYCDASTIEFKTRKRGIRYCYDVKTSCKYCGKYCGDEEAYEDCINGTTGLLSCFGHMYKNLGCLTCNIKKSEPVFEPISISTAIETSEKQPYIDLAPNNEEQACASHEIYDAAANLCRRLFLYNANSSKTHLKQSAVRLTFKQNKTSCPIQIMNENGTNYVRQNLSNLLTKKLDTYQQQRFKNESAQWHFHDFDVYLGANRTIVTFQILTLRSLNQTMDMKYFTEELKIWKIEVSFVHSESDCVFVLESFDTKDAFCLDNKTYPVIFDDLQAQNGSIYLNATEKMYKPGEFMLYQYENETRVALCLDSKPADCLYHMPVSNRSRWEEFDNRSIYSMVTKSWFHYGEYSRINGSLWLCVTNNFTRQTRWRLVSSRSIHKTILGYATVVSMIMSIVSLIILLLVYSMFSALRNLPGKNLMLFAAVLALAQSSWLIQNVIILKSPGLCTTMNVIMQYLLLATFSCSLAIAVHSFATFNALSKGKLTRRSEGGLFLKYAMFGLGLPLFYVVGCLFLDTNDVVPFSYGTPSGHCWFGTTRALYMGFLYPGLFLLLCNMVLFFATLRVIHKCTKASQKLAEKNGTANKQHFGIYVRMSTVMGFTWLVAVFNIIFPDAIVFDYIFTFLNGFQGVYLAFAFLSTANVRKIVLKTRRKKMDNLTSNITREMSTTNM